MKGRGKKIAKEMLLAILIKFIDKNPQNQQKNFRSFKLLIHLIIQLKSNRLYDELFKKLPQKYKSKLTALQDNTINIENTQNGFAEFTHLKDPCRT